MSFSFLDEHLGRCPRCMRSAFLFMLGAWGLAAVVLVVGDGALLQLSAGIVAAGATLLGTAHVTAFALRAATGEAEPGRRRILAFMGAATFAISVTALPGGAFAQRKCPCRAPLVCCWDYKRVHHDCMPADAHCCTHATNPWHCNARQDCNGDGSQRPRCRNRTATTTPPPTHTPAGPSTG